MPNHRPKGIERMRYIGSLNKGTPKNMDYIDRVLKGVKAARTRSGENSWTPEHEAAWLDGFRRGIKHALRWPTSEIFSW